MTSLATVRAIELPNFCLAEVSEYKKAFTNARSIPEANG